MRIRKSPLARTFSALPLMLLLGVCLALSACGSSNKQKHASTASTKTQSAASSEAKLKSERAQQLKESVKYLAVPSQIAPSTVLAHVGSTPITFAVVSKQMKLQSPKVPIPDPPSYTGCIARLKSEKGNAGKAEAQLKEECRQNYEQIFQRALSNTIHNQWLIGEAAEEGVHVGAREVEQEFDASKKQFRTEAEFATYRKGSGQTIADMKEEIKVGKLANGIFENIKRKEHPVTDAAISAYYEANRKKFTIPEGRDVRIVRTTTEISALRIKHELKSGKSFASVAKELSSIAQPITAQNGEVKDLTPNLFEEKVLNDAIFQAEPNRLYGPQRVTSIHRTIAPESNSGFFLFEVVKIVPARLVPLAKVKHLITEELVSNEKNKTLASAVAAIKAKWRSRTDCETGYVVKNCRQYSSTAPSEEGDPYTL